LAEAVSRLGDAVHEIAILWLVYEVTGDPLLLSVVVIASVVPNVFVSLPAGVMVDRLHRTRVMIATNLVRGIAVLAIPAVGRGSQLVPVVILVAAVASTMEAFFGPARNALVPNLVERTDLESANSLLQLTTSASGMLYAAGGLVVGVFGSFAAFYVDAISFIAAAALLALIPQAAGKTDSDGDSLVDSIGTDIVSGLRFVWRHRVLTYVVLMWVLTGVAMGPLGVVIPVFAETTLGSGSTVFGLLYGLIYAGIFTGGLWLNRFADRVAEHRGRLIIGGMVAAGAAFAAAAVLPRHTAFPVGVAGAWFFVVGLGTVCIWVPARAISQEVPDDVRGRVSSVVSATSTAVPPVSVAVVGPMLTVLDGWQVLLAEGGLLAVAGVALALTPLRRASRSPKPAES
jgi:MFS family permease